MSDITEIGNNSVQGCERRSIKEVTFDLDFKGWAGIWEKMKVQRAIEGEAETRDLGRVREQQDCEDGGGSAGWERVENECG